MKRKCGMCGQRGVNMYLPINPCFREEAERYGYPKTVPETLNEKKYICRYCYATDRERLCAAFVNRIFGKKDYKLNVLEIAPGGAIGKFFSEKHPFCEYKTADLFMDDVDYKVDVQDMKEIMDGQFDIIVCFHVLEHVQDDRKALHELHRILSENGLGIFLVPIDLLQEEIDEEWGCSEAENIRRFGQADHVRKYSKNGFVRRMQDVGFKVLSLDTKWFGIKNTWDNAFTKTSTLYVVTKNTKYEKENLNKVFQIICY